MSPWHGVDFDGTLAEYDKWRGATHCGAPIPKMVERVKSWFAAGVEVRIFTARVFPLMMVLPNDNLDQILGLSENITPRHVEAAQAVLAIQVWCQEHLGRIIPITCVKDYGMIYLYDDRCFRVEKNTGRIIGVEEA